MADTMVTKKTNITTVCEEDKIFIRALMSLSSEKKMHPATAASYNNLAGVYRKHGKQKKGRGIVSKKSANT